uniref:SPARC like 1 n=1 Tax=Pipistrellus kuhlii TaxID=59472 RepID=A0A7J8B4S3_PIPKU|nr:SPARC like 1 [Pipistrellus kuhlii]
MKTVLFFLYILGTAAAIPTNARFLSDHSQPTAESLSSIQQAELLVTPGDTTVPILGVEDAEDEKETIVSIEEQPNNQAEKSPEQKLKEKNHDQSEDQGLQDQEESESDFSETLEDALTEDALDLKEEMSEPQKEKLPENTDFLAPDVSSTVDSNRQENITKTEENQEELITDSHPQSNRSSKHGEDLGDEENQEQDPMTCPPTKLLDQVCGTDNQTYASSCHLFATKCRLEGTKKGHQLQLDYFGACKSIPACTDFEVTQFPLRMRDWLKNILMQLYEPNPEHGGYLNEKQRNKVKKIYLDEKRLLAGDHSIDLLLRDFKKNYHMYVYPVHWQFSELDQHPMDRVLTHSELAPLRASLVPMEHCITRFFDECDPNKDKHITLKEWGHCFGIKEEDIDENLLF